MADIAEGKADIRIIWREFGDNIADDLLRLGGRHRAFFDLFVDELLGNDDMIFKSDVAAERRQQRVVEPGRARAHRPGEVAQEIGRASCRASVVSEGCTRWLPCN